jgi:hypothetical protein
MGRMTLLGAGKQLSGASAEVSQFLARTSGLDGTHTAAYSTLIDGLVADGLWSLLDVLYMFATQDSVTALLNLKSGSHSASLVNAPSFAFDQGFTGGVTPVTFDQNYLRSNFIPSSDGVAYTQDSASFGLYLRNTTSTSGGGANSIIGSFKSTGFGDDQSVYYFDLGGSTGLVRINSNNGIDVPFVNEQGFFALTRTSGTASAAYKNGSSIATGSATSTGVTNAEIFILNLNGGSGSSAVSSLGNQCAAAFLGGGLNSAQAANLSSRVNTYMTSVGAGVY